MSLGLRFEAELKKLIAAESTRLIDQLSGGALTDFAHYQNICGRVAALTLVADEFCPMVEKKLSEG